MRLAGDAGDRIRLAIARCASTAAGLGTEAGVRIPILGEDAAPALLIEVRALRDTAAELDPGLRGAVMFVIDPSHGNVVDEIGLTSLYGLTAAESEVARLLLDGRSVDQISDIRRTARETTRNQIKSILSKTGTSRQLDLVRLATLISPPVTAPSPPIGTA
jgi:DNA-binding CsgD family transcriptional regulator